MFSQVIVSGLHRQAVHELNGGRDNPALGHDRGHGGDGRRHIRKRYQQHMRAIGSGSSRKMMRVKMPASLLNQPSDARHRNRDILDSFAAELNDLTGRQHDSIPST